MKNFANIEELENWLNDAGIDTSLWGEGNAKTVSNLWQELVSGDIALQEEPPLRHVHVVQILIRKGKQLLIEVEQELANGQRRFRNQPPSEKIKSNESYKEAAQRCLHEELGVLPENINFLTETYEQIIRVSDSMSYPGLTTQYTFHIITVQIEGLPKKEFWRDNLAYTEGDPVKRHLWIWRYQG